MWPPPAVDLLVVGASGSLFVVDLLSPFRRRGVGSVRKTLTRPQPLSFRGIYTNIYDVKFPPPHKAFLCEHLEC